MVYRGETLKSAASDADASASVASAWVLRERVITERLACEGRPFCVKVNYANISVTTISNVARFV